MNTGVDGGSAIWLGPLVIAAALVTMIMLISLGLRRTNAASRAARGRGRAIAPVSPLAALPVPGQRDASEHEVGGGFYRYTPGMYSHSYSPEEIQALESAEKKALDPA